MGVVETFVRRHRRAMVGTGPAAAVLSAWQIAGSQEGQTAELVASPVAVGQAIAALAASGELVRHGLVTLRELAAGLALAIAVGIGLGLALGRSRVLRGLLDPVVMAFHVTPRVALLPLLVLWFGVGCPPRWPPSFWQRCSPSS